jgi:hypothetical protein
LEGGPGGTVSGASGPEKRAASVGSPAGAAWDATDCRAFALAEALPPAAREIPNAAPNPITTQAMPVPTSLSTR